MPRVFGRLDLVGYLQRLLKGTLNYWYSTSRLKSLKL